MPPRGAVEHAGPVQPTHVLSMTTQSRAQAGLNAPATTPLPGPSTSARNVATMDDEPLPVYPGPVPLNPHDDPTTEEVPAYHSLPRTVPIPSSPPPAIINPSAANDQNTEVLAAIREIATNQAELSWSITRTQQEVVELRSVVGSV